MLLCVVVVVVVLTRAEARKCLFQQSPVLIGMGSRRCQRTLRHRGLQKLALNFGTTWRSAKNASEPPKTPLKLRHHPDVVTDSVLDCRTCLCMITGRRPLHVAQEARHLVHSPHVPCPSPAAATTTAASPPKPPPYRPGGQSTPTPAGRSSTAPRYCMVKRAAGQHEHLVGKVGETAIET